jgi:serine/threonine protein kinase
MSYRWQRVEEIFQQAIELAPQARSAFLDEACGGDQSLRQEVESLLAHEPEDGATLAMDDHVRRILAEMLKVPAENRQAFLDQACGEDVDAKAAILRLAAVSADTEEKSGASTSRLPPGKELAGRFGVIRFLARGGMGDVYEVEDLTLGERIALKTIRREAVGDARTLARFKREIQYAKRVTHPNVCRIYDLGSHQEGDREILFLTMELLRGETLAHQLRTTGRIAPPKALPLIVQMAEGLAAAHDAGIIHRDFKTSNVMLTGSKAVVTDFGLARPSDRGDDVSLTESGRMVGTPAYMAPEQLTGGELTPATDVYALGLVIYETITGRKPFTGDTPIASALKRLTDPAPAVSGQVPGLNASWEAAIMRCLERDPARRFQSPRDLVLALTEDRAPTQTLTASPKRSWTNGIRSRTRPLAIVASVSGLALLGTVFAVMWSLGRHHPPAAALRWYEQGTRALRDGTSFTAMSALQRAVDIDPAFSLAHARLAEAATDLDYFDKAKGEMLRASPPAFRSFFLSSEEKLRLEAVYFVLVNDFANAAAKYKELADQVSPEERASVLVDLGRAYESGVKFQEALASYTESIAKDNQFAAAFLRRAELEGRQRLNDNASNDFAAAEQLYRREGNSEGITEVSYQKALLLRRTGKLADARPLAENALERARSDRDEFHQVKALLMLSFLLYNSGDAEAGEQRGKEAIDLARRAGIESLSASGLAEVGMALFIKGDNRGAEVYLRDALETAKRFQDLQVQGRAEMTLEQVLMKTGRAEEAFAVLKDAMQHLEKAGDKSGTARAAILAARVLRDRGDYGQAAILFRQGLDLAERAKDQGAIALSAQGLGAVLLLQEKYPEALADFTRSAEVSHTSGDPSQEAYSHLTRADALRFLGRYKEASEELAKAEQLDEHLNAGKPLLASINFSRAEMDLSRLRLADAEQDIRGMQKASNAIIVASAKRLLGLQRLQTGRVREALTLCQEAGNMAKTLGDIALLKNSELALAQARLASGDKAGALELASTVLAYFGEKGKRESELRALAILIEATRGPERDRYVERAKASLATLRSDFAADFPGFAARPDIHQIITRAGLTSDVQ